MKRLWFGMALLVVLLAAGTLSTFAMERFHHNLSRHLDAAVSAALEEDWDHTQEILHQCRSRWVRFRSAVAANASHEPIEEIDSLYSQLDLYLARRDSMGFALCCTTLRHRTEALGEAQSINWWNLL